MNKLNVFGKKKVRAEMFAVDQYVIHCIKHCIVMKKTGWGWNAFVRFHPKLVKFSFYCVYYNKQYPHKSFALQISQFEWSLDLGSIDTKVDLHNKHCTSRKSLTVFSAVCQQLSINLNVSINAKLLESPWLVQYNKLQKVLFKNVWFNQENR